MKLTSKRRAFLRKKAVKLKAMVRVGKDGLTDAIIDSINDVIKSRELLKVKVLENSEVRAKEMAIEIADKSESELVQVLGGTILLFKENREKPIISSELKGI